MLSDDFMLILQRFNFFITLFSIVQQFQMRTRYYSPEVGKVLEEQKNIPSKKMHWAGSMKQLPKLDFVMEDTTCHIGSYIYENNRPIGMGYSSKVYLGKSINPNQNQQYAIKVIDLKHFTKSNSNTNIQLLQNEIKILKKVNHPNILKFYDVYRTETHCYIVTEYCKYGDLMKYINLKKNSSIEQSTVNQIMSSIVEGYKYLIKQGILHRDIKPANIMKGQDNLWKLGDFGFALQQKDQIRSSFNVGTPLYMPPESLLKNKYSCKSDIFSIGIIFYELIFGQTPWQSKSQKQLVQKITNIPLKIPEHKNNISIHARRLIHKMCAINPNQRMNKEEFLAIQINYQALNPQNWEEQQRKYSIKLKKVSSMKQFRPLCLQQKINSIQTNSTEDQPPIKIEDSKLQIQIKNNNIILSQLNYCRFLYYLIKNSFYFCFNSKNRDKLCLIIFKHIIKIVKQLSDNKNWFHLENWNQFKQTKRYAKTLQTIEQYSLRYEKQYLSYLKKLQITVIKQVNHNLQQFVGIDHLTKKSYQCTQKILVQLIRQYNHNLSILLARNSLYLTTQLSASALGLKNLLKYRSLLEMSSEHYLQFEYFQRKCDIKVQIDYRNQNCTYNDFMAMRNQIKYI